jgi:hypothetical protein
VTPYIFDNYRLGLDPDLVKNRIPKYKTVVAVYVPVAKLMLEATVEFRKRLMFSAWRFFSSSTFIQNPIRVFQSAGNPYLNLQHQTSFRSTANFGKYPKPRGGGEVGWGKTYRLMSFGGEEKYEKGEEQKMRKK